MNDATDLSLDVSEARPGKGLLGDDPMAWQDLYRLLADNAREMVSRHSTDLTFLFSSPASRRVLGYPAEDLIGVRLDDLVHPDDLSALVSACARAMDLDVADSSEVVVRLRHCDQSWRWCEAFLSGADNPDNQILELHATVRDVTAYKQIEKAIERVAQEWRSTFDSARDAIVLIDPKARILRVNRATTELLGLNYAELLMQPLNDILARHLGLNDPFGIAESFEAQGQTRRDLRLNDTATWVRSSFDPIIDPHGRVTGAVLFITDITSEKRAEQRQSKTLSQLRKLSSHLQSVREEERKYIAQEVHDELGHALTVLKMDLAWLVKRLPETDAIVLERGRGLRDLLDRTISAMRRITSELRPPVLDDLGLDAAIEWLSADFHKRTGIEVHCRLPDQPVSIRGHQASNLFRIVQEALTNVARHAEADRVELDWRQDDDGLRLTILDNGRGFDPADPASDQGLGLLGMRERVHDQGGRLDLTSQPGRGTRIVIDWPLESAP